MAARDPGGHFHMSKACGGGMTQILRVALSGWYPALILILAAGCATRAARNGNPDFEPKAERLAEALTALSPGVDSNEALAVAHKAYVTSWELARRYHAVWPAGYHNFLVNQGKRERGLCWHWADDLESGLSALRLRTLEMHRGVARLGHSGEHSAVVLTAVGQPFGQGIVLDAWRHGGSLYWATVANDSYFYPWIRVRVVD